MPSDRPLLSAQAKRNDACSSPSGYRARTAYRTGFAPVRYVVERDVGSLPGRPDFVLRRTPRFSKWSDEFLDDDAFSALLQVLVTNPSFGKGLGQGLRKLRIGLPGRGKRGGARVIYSHVASDDQIYLLYGYAKNEQADLTKAQVAYLAALMREELDG